MEYPIRESIMLSRELHSVSSAECVTSRDWQRVPLSWRLGRMFCSLFRFSELRVAQFLSRRLPPSLPCVVSLYGRQMHVDLGRSSAQQLLVLLGDRFITEQELFRKWVKPGMRVVDIGANIGYHVLFLAFLVGPQGRITAIEPSPENLPELKANISRNQLQNVDLRELAIGARSCSVHVKTGINSGILVSGDGIAEVPMVALSDIVSEPVDFVKIDVDGYEGEVIAGAVEYLAKYKPTLLIELHPHLLPGFGTTTGAVVDRLRRIYPRLRGYDHFRRGDESLLKRIARKYGAPTALREIANLDDAIRAADEGKHEWTFWVVASAD